MESGRDASVPAAVGGTDKTFWSETRRLFWDGKVLNRVRVEGGKVFEMRWMVEGRGTLTKVSLSDLFGTDTVGETQSRDKEREEQGPELSCLCVRVCFNGQSPKL